MLVGESSDVAAAAAADEDEGVGGGEDVRRIQSRWPKEETLALIKIRSEMEKVFRESSGKGPLWEEVSRKLAGLGYHRSGKKCREKFENVYKYHKRTKDGRPSPTAAAAPAPHPSGKSKTYRFFDQLQAMESNPVVNSLVSLPPPLPSVMPTFMFPVPAHSDLPHVQQSTNNFSTPTVYPIGNPSFLHAAVSNDSKSSSTYSDQDLHRQHYPGDDAREDKSMKRRRRRKRKKSEWMEVFEKLMGEVVRKQEELQKNLFDVIERRERERLKREEAWRAQEVARIDRECEMLARDRSSAAAKDNAVISFLQRIADQQQKNSMPREKFRDGDNNVVGNGRNLLPLQQTVVQFSVVEGMTKTAGSERVDNGEKNFGSSSRWPRAEIEALIKLRTNSQSNYGENATKGPLWEEISTSMKKLGYNRNPKRCKEKWENINKYFKKVKESNKKRRDDSKTCPYFELLDEIYNLKVGKNNDANFFLSFRSSDSNNNVGSFSAASPPLMVSPEQQWPPLLPPHRTSEQELGVGDTDGDYDDDEGEDRGEKFEVVANKVF